MVNRNVRLRAHPRMAAAVLLLGLAPGLATLPAASGATPARSMHPATAPHATRSGGPLPDSLLARVGAHRHVSLATFRRSWYQVVPPQRPDSLTPESARRFLDLLIGKEVLGEVALRTRWAWTSRESAEYLGLADRLTMKAVLDSALKATFAARAARGDTIADLERLGTVTRDSSVARMHVAFDTTLTRRLAAVWAAIPRPSRDSSLMAQLRVLGTLPRVPPADTGRVLAHSGDGEIRVSELMASWARLDPLVRPRIELPSQIEDLARNALFERMLRREAERRGLRRWPEIAGALDREREYIAVSHLVTREVYDGLEPDSISLRRYYDAHRADYALPMRVRVLELDLPGRDAATRMALELRERARAESLMARGRRRGADYVVELALESDSVRFARALRAGGDAVLGPDSTARGWAVSRVLAVIPARERGFEEALPLVEHAWYGAEGERRMVATLAKLRRGVPVTVNDRALRRLLAEGIGAPPAPPGLPAHAAGAARAPVSNPR